MSERPGRPRARGGGADVGLLVVMSLGVVCAFSTWFSTTAVAGALGAERGWSAGDLTWLTIATQFGFAVGAVGASWLTLPDIVRPRVLMAAASATAAIANLAPLADLPFPWVWLARFIVGAALASVYPPALKVVGAWWSARTGFAYAWIIGALTLGTALPHAVRVAGGVDDWRWVIEVSSLAALRAAGLFAWRAVMPDTAKASPRFDPSQIGRVLGDPAQRRVIVGYCGHTWELYGLWAVILSWAVTAPALGDADGALASLFAFIMVGIGVIGCFVGVAIAERVGRANAAVVLTLVSGAATLLLGALYDGPVALLFAVALVWGIASIGDSAQYSAAARELADESFVGTALALQMGLGFTVAIVPILTLPLLAEWLGSWRWALLPLALGALVGAPAMRSLTRQRGAARLTGG